MSVYKFACPVCGQHITTDSSARITQMECPTCFNNLHVPPPPPAGAPTNLVLTTSVVSNRPLPPKPVEKTATAPVQKKIPLVPIIAVALVAALGAGAFVFRDKLFKSSQSQPPQPTNAVAKKETKPKATGFVPPKNDPHWSLALSKLKFPETPAGGRIDGKNFALEKATLTGGTLSFRQGSGKVADLGLSIYLTARQGQDLEGQVLAIEKDVEQAVKVTLRWKNPDDPEKTVQKSYSKGYAMRLAFGEVTGKQISGKIYLCTPDKAHSYVAGTFVADIRKPAAPKAATPTKQK